MDLRNASLTGRKRFRIERTWRRELLVLQVEERGMETTSASSMNGHGEWVTYWRDATVADMEINVRSPMQQAAE